MEIETVDGWIVNGSEFDSILDSLNKSRLKIEEFSYLVESLIIKSLNDKILAME